MSLGVAIKTKLFKAIQAFNYRYFKRTITAFLH